MKKWLKIEVKTGPSKIIEKMCQLAPKVVTKVVKMLERSTRQDPKLTKISKEMSFLRFLFPKILGTAEDDGRMEGMIGYDTL